MMHILCTRHFFSVLIYSGRRERQHSSTYRYHIYQDSLPCLTLSKRQILNCSKLKEFAVDNFKFDENGRKLSKWIKNTAIYPFPTVFSKACTLQPVLETTCINPFPNNNFQTVPKSKSLQKTISNLMEMAEISPNG